MRYLIRDWSSAVYPGPWSVEQAEKRNPCAVISLIGDVFHVSPKFRPDENETCEDFDRALTIAAKILNTDRSSIAYTRGNYPTGKVEDRRDACRLDFTFSVRDLSRWPVHGVLLRLKQDGWIEHCPSESHWSFTHPKYPGQVARLYGADTIEIE